MPTIEEMSQELKTAGYEIEVVDGVTVFGRITTPSGWQYTVYYGMYIQNTLREIYQKNREIATEKAYEHYLEQQRSAKMNALLREAIEWFDKPLEIRDIDMLNGVMALQFAKTVGEAKEILAEKETS